MPRSARTDARSSARTSASKPKRTAKPASPERAALAPAPRVEVAKTFKLYVNGQFPRSESGRSMEVHHATGEVFAHVSLASRKDVRDAVVAARSAFDASSGWPRRTAYNRGQILYRLAEMLEARRDELVEAIQIADEPAAPARARTSARTSKNAAPVAPSASDEVTATIDRLVAYAGWADKFVHVLGCQNPVAGPYYNFTTPEPTGVVFAIAPDERPLLALVSLIVPAVVSGNCVVALASERNPIPACILGDACAVSDVPAGVVNILTGQRAELVPTIAGHRDIDAVHAANVPAQIASALRAGAAENLKRVTVRDVPDAHWFDAQRSAGPWWIERFVEMKTIWHPVGA